MKRKYRCSSLPRFLACPSSELPTAIPYESPHDANLMGKAVHEALEAVVHGATPSTEIIARRHGVDLDELERLVAYGRIAWREVGRHMPHARAEEKLEGQAVRGTADVFSRTPDTMTILDWKTGFVRRNCAAQLLGYAAAAADTYGLPPSGDCRVVVVWLRSFEMEVRTYTADDIERLHHDLARAERDTGKRYNPGEACEYCPRQLDCEGRRAYLQSAACAIAPLGESPVSPERLASLYAQSRALRKALDHYDHALRSVLREGPLPTADGDLLELAETGRDTIDARAAWPVLLDQGFSEDDLAACVSIGKTALLNIAARKAPKGQKGKARGELVQLLRGTGAIKRDVSQRISLRRIG